MINLPSIRQMNEEIEKMKVLEDQESIFGTKVKKPVSAASDVIAVEGSYIPLGTQCGKSVACDAVSVCIA